MGFAFHHSFDPIRNDRARAIASCARECRLADYRAELDVFTDEADAARDALERELSQHDEADAQRLREFHMKKKARGKLVPIASLQPKRAKGMRLLIFMLAYASLCSVFVAWLIGGGN